MERARSLMVPFAVFALSAIAIALTTPASASSYSGSGDWVIAANASETVTGETVNVLGNVSVFGTLELFNSTLTVDRNVSVVGSLRLNATRLTFTVDAVGTNYLRAEAGAVVSITDYDGDISTPADQSVLEANAFAFNSTFSPGSQLVIKNSRVDRAGWSRLVPVALGPGFDMRGATLTVEGCTFRGGFEVFVLVNVTTNPVRRNIFDGAVSAFNITGAGDYVFENNTMVNHTYGLRFNHATTVLINGFFASQTASIAYFPPFAGPPGTAILVEAADDVLLTNVSIFGRPGVLYPRQVGGFVIRNATNVTVSFSTGNIGDFFGQAVAVSQLRLFALQISRFALRSVFDRVDNLSIAGVLLEEEAGGFEVRNVGDLTATDVGATLLTVPALTGTNLTGAAVLSRFVVNGSLAVANLSWTSALGSLQMDNMTGNDLSYGITVAAPTLTPLRLQDISLARLNLSAVVINVTSVRGLEILNLSVDQTGGWALEILATAASASTAKNLTLHSLGLGGVSLAAVAADNVSITGVSATNASGPVVQLRVNTTLDDVLVNGVASLNSTGSLVDVSAARVRRFTAVALNMTQGDVLPPPATQGAVSLACNAAEDVRVAGLVVNVSSRGAFYLTATSGVNLVFEDFDVGGLVLDAIFVDGAGPGWSIDILNVTASDIGGAGVHLGAVGGRVRIADVYARSSVGVQLDGTADVLIENFTHEGPGAGVLVTGGTNVTAKGLATLDGFGFDALGSSNLLVDGADVQASVWAVRATTVTNLTVRGLRASNSTGGVSFINVTDSLIDSPTVTFTGIGIQVTILSHRVHVRGAVMASPPSTTAGTMLQLASSTDVNVSDVSFAGRCLKAVVVSGVTRANLTRISALTCGDGAELASSTFVELSDFAFPSAFSGSGLVVTGSSDVRVTNGVITGSASLGIIVTGASRVSLAGLDASGSRGDGALLAFVANSTFSGIVMDGASGTGLRVLYAGPNVTFSKTSARACAGGVEILTSSNLTFSDFDASANLGIGIYNDANSFDNTFRNLTLAGNAWNGLLVSANRTRLIDGNVTGNGQAGVAVAPGVRLDWTIETSGSLTDERVDLSGDLLVFAGASFAAHNTTVTIEQTARLSAFQPTMVVSLGAGARLSFDKVTLQPRDARIPYTITAAAGSWIQFENSTIEGGNSNDPDSVMSAISSNVRVVWTDFDGWGVPLDLTFCQATMVDATFNLGGSGPRLVGGNATLVNVSSTNSGGDGVFFDGLASLDAYNVYSAFNSGFGVVVSRVAAARMDALTAINNSLGGLKVTRSNVTAVGVLLEANSAAGGQVQDCDLFEVDGFTSQSNAGSGVSFLRIVRAKLTLGRVANNGGSGVFAQDVTALSLNAGEVRSNAVFGLHVVGVTTATVEGVAFSLDGFANVRLEGVSRATIGNSTMATTSDHAIMVFGSADAVLTNVVASGNLSGLVATDSSTVFVLNSSVGDPSVLNFALVRIGWHLRVITQTSAGAPAPSTAVNVTDATGARVGSGATDASGSSPLMAIVERRLHSDGTQEVFGPQKVEAASALYGRGRATVNVTRYTALGLRLDNSTPVSDVTMLGAQGQAGWFLGPVTVRLHAVDDRAQGLTVAARLGTDPWTFFNSTGSSVSGTLLVSAEGVFPLEYYALDDGGNAEPLRRTEVRVDLNEPVVSVVPIPATVFDPHLAFSWSATDLAGSGVEAFTITYARDNGNDTTWLNATTATQAAFVADDGFYSFKFLAYDRAGQSSVPVYSNVTVALNGELRLRVIEAGGPLLSNVSLWIDGVLVQENVSGDIAVRDLRAGNRTVMITVGGYDNATFHVAIRPHEVSDLGNVTMARTQTAAPGIDLTAGFLILAGLLLLTAAYGIWMRRKWRSRKPPKGP